MYMCTCVLYIPVFVSQVSDVTSFPLHSLTLSHSVSFTPSLLHSVSPSHSHTLTSSHPHRWMQHWVLLTRLSKRFFVAWRSEALRTVSMS